MFNRILFSTIAAATLLTAAPTTLAAEGTASTQPCSCCSDGSVHEADHRLREEAKRKNATTQQPGTSDDPYVRNQSFGG